MSAHLTDEEQLEALKRWWKENGSSTVASIAIALAGYFGWQYWQTSQQTQAEAASAVYQQMLEASDIKAGESISDESLATESHLAGVLKSDFGGSFYAQQAALLLAKRAVDKNSLDKAAEELTWVLAKNPEESVLALTHLRLAKVRYAQTKYEDALSELSAVDAGVFASVYAELKGDISLAQGDQQSARASYQLALTSLLDAERARATLLQMKVNDLKTAPVNVYEKTEAGAETTDTSPSETNEEPVATPAAESTTPGEDA